MEQILAMGPGNSNTYTIFSGVFKVALAIPICRPISSTNLIPIMKF